VNLSTEFRMSANIRYISQNPVARWKAPSAFSPRLPSGPVSALRLAKKSET
jgi:hypothetical protein